MNEASCEREQKLQNGSKIWNSTNTRGFIQGQHQSSQHVSQSRLSFLICPILLGVDQNGKSLVGQFDDVREETTPPTPAASL
jgi:hypothetical protein